MLESNGFYVICLLDTEFNLVWTSFDIVDTVPEIGEYENVSAKDFDAMVNSIVNSMQGVSDNDISLYYKNLSYVQNQYLQMLYQYDNEEGRELWEYLEEALELSENVAEQKLIQYNQYYNTQIKIQNYFQKRVNFWTPSY